MRVWKNSCLTRLPSFCSIETAARLGGNGRKKLNLTSVARKMMMPSQSVPGASSSLCRFLVLGVAAICAGLLMSARLAPAQSGQTLRLVVAFAPGGGVDVVARIIGERVAASTGQTVVVENRPGAA